MNKKIYIIGIGGIGVSGIARYYNEKGYLVFGSDKTDSELIGKLKNEGIDIFIGLRPSIIDSSFEKVIYSESISIDNEELISARSLGITTLSYPESVGEIGNNMKMIAISGTHGKSTTTSLTSLIFKNSTKDFTSIVGTLLFEFGGKNYYSRDTGKDEKYFIIEACEYKRSFLNYKPYILVITNIEIDHLDYYNDENDYVNAYKELINNVRQGGYVILNGQDKNSRDLIRQRDNINYIVVDGDEYSINGQTIKFPIIDMRVPGGHILFDARCSFVVSQLVDINKELTLDTLNNYNGAWRRMEYIGLTANNNVLISDYGHHPTEIKLTLETIRDKYRGSQILTIFQPHQFNRTWNLLDDFIDSFIWTDELIIPNIYESRDSKTDKEKMNAEIFVEKLNHKNKQLGYTLENTLKLINEFDSKNANGVIVLMGAGDVDNLRYQIIRIPIL